MDIILISIICSAIIVLITVIVGFKQVLDAVKQTNTENRKKEEILSENQEKLVALIENKSSEIITQFVAELHRNLEQNIRNITEIKSLILSLESNLNTYTTTVEKYSQNSQRDNIDLKTKLNNNFSNVIQLVNNLRLTNLINLSNEIGKYKEGIYEDNYFIQEVGHCKVIKITDKRSGEITNVSYDGQGNKSHTKTFQNNILKYAMDYEDDKLIKGVEFNLEQNITFEYFYDEVGEIKKKIEYIYDDNHKLKEIKETNY